MIRREDKDKILFSIARDEDEKDEFVQCLMQREYEGRVVNMARFRYPANKIDVNNRVAFHAYVDKVITYLFLGSDGIETYKTPPEVVRKTQSADGRTVLADESGKANDTSIADAMKEMP